MMDNVDIRELRTDLHRWDVLARAGAPTDGGREPSRWTVDGRPPTASEAEIIGSARERDFEVAIAILKARRESVEEEMAAREEIADLLASTAREEGLPEEVVCINSLMVDLSPESAHLFLTRIAEVFARNGQQALAASVRASGQAALDEM